ncbi:hypothetical protein [Gimesia sp.]|uniref:hypothetical protein n=1 Tax=Gimesia sp. TaxID=2024833 RepID=UPI0025BF42E3|nr:hypothetical protein [Gimesia sp.]
MNNIMWRYGLTGDRPAATSGRCRGEALRCVATRRVTSRTSVLSGSANREKTGSFLVKINNSCRVFRCSVNWARARPKTALIAVGTQRSSSFYAAGVRKCVAAGVGSSVLQANGGVGGEACVDHEQRDAWGVVLEPLSKKGRNGSSQCNCSYQMQAWFALEGSE